MLPFLGHLNEITLLIVLSEHWLYSLDQKYVPFGIHCDPGAFAAAHAFRELEKIVNDLIRKLWNRLK